MTPLLMSVLRRPPAASANTRNHFDALQPFRRVLFTLSMAVRVAASLLAHRQHNGVARLRMEGGKASPLTTYRHLKQQYYELQGRWTWGVTARFGIKV